MNLRAAAYRAYARRRAGLPLLSLGRLSPLARLAPVTRGFAFDRGTPVDRFFIERFLRQFGGEPGYRESDVRGRVLEVGGSEYAHMIGGPDVHADVLHVDESNPEATLIGDLETGAGIPAEAYDCIICTQTLHLLFEVSAAVDTLHRALRPGGVLLVTVPALTPRCRQESYSWGDYWRITPQAARRLFEQRFPPGAVRVDAFGNLRSATAFLHGLVADELSEVELDLEDPDYTVIVGVRAVKPGL